VTVDITVNPLGQVDAIANQVVCPGDATTLVTLSSSNTGTTTYTWTNDTPSIGLAASGTSSTIPSFTAINATASPIVATINVTPTFVDGSVNCLGTSTSFTITVNPTPTIILSSAVSSTNQIICVNAPITPIQYTFGANSTGVTITGLPLGVTYTTNGSIVTISGTPTTTTAAIYNYSITATGNPCGAPNLSGTIEVTSGILPLFNQVVPVCQGATINIPTTSTNGIVGVWNLISSTANDVTYQFIPNAGQCALNTTMTIVVHPLPIVTPSVTTQSFCSGGTTNINLTSNVPGTTFSWTATATTTTGQAGSVTGSGATSINQTLVLNANQVASGQVTYVIVAEANGCLGAPVTVVVTVNPIPNVVVSPAAQTICSGQTTSISFSGAINNTVFTWNVLSSVGVSGALNGTGNAINQILTTTGLSQGTVVYEVTPSLNGCVGTPQTITVTVNPVPELFGSATHPELCSGESTFISVSTFSATTVFNWVVEPFGVSGASAGSATGSSILIEQALSTTGNTQGYVDYIITPVLTACAGTPITVRVYVNPLPVVSLTDGTICVDAAGVPFQTYLLDSGLDNANYDFVWTFEGNTISNATQATYSAAEVGTYTVVATNSTTNCVSNIASAVVTATNPATSLTVAQSDYFSDNATLTVTVAGGNGTLLYQLDAGILQESNVFTGVSGGSHTITVVDTQGCTYLTQEVLIIDYPRYFTPNGDGHNDTWNITSLNQPDAKLFIFDRYGKLIKQIVPSSSSSGWDGTYNNAILPSTDYWFTLDYTENGAAKQFKAHFSLKR
jgi:gliding motility-associated-like protein